VSLIHRCRVRVANDRDGLLSRPRARSRGYSRGDVRSLGGRGHVGLSRTPPLDSRPYGSDTAQESHAAAAGAALLRPNDTDVVRAAAWLHDIGYAAGLVDTGCHPIDGARHLRRLDAPNDVVELSSRPATS